MGRTYRIFDQRHLVPDILVIADKLRVCNDVTAECQMLAGMDGWMDESQDSLYARVIAVAHSVEAIPTVVVRCELPLAAIPHVGIKDIRLDCYVSLHSKVSPRWSYRLARTGWSAKGPQVCWKTYEFFIGYDDGRPVFIPIDPIAEQAGMNDTASQQRSPPKPHSKITLTRRSAQGTRGWPDGYATRQSRYCESTR
jgi:hypothetical protein